MSKYVRAAGGEESQESLVTLVLKADLGGLASGARAQGIQGHGACREGRGAVHGSSLRFTSLHKFNVHGARKGLMGLGSVAVLVLTGGPGRPGLGRARAAVAGMVRVSTPKDRSVVAPPLLRFHAMSRGRSAHPPASCPPARPLPACPPTARRAQQPGAAGRAAGLGGHAGGAGAGGDVGGGAARQGGAGPLRGQVRVLQSSTAAD